MKLTPAEHAELLRGACLHCARDAERQTDLFGLELADGQYIDNPDRAAVECFVGAQLRGLERLIMHLYDGHWKAQDAQEDD